MKLRDAFERACAPRRKSLAIGNFGEHGEAELSKILGGERRPTFALFAYVAERFGVKVEKPAAPLAAQLELFGAELVSLSTRIGEALDRAKAQERAGMARVSPPQQKRSRA